MRGFFAIFLFSLVVSSAEMSQAQRVVGNEPKPCTKNPINKGKYKILYLGFGDDMQLSVEIKPAYRNDRNYVTIAREFRERYCQIEELWIEYFASKKQWQISDPSDPQSAPLAIYYFGADADNVGLEVISLINGKVESRKINLSDYWEPPR